METKLECFDAAACPPEFGLANPGVQCYFNSLLQALLSCSSFVGALRAPPNDLARTATGAALAALAAAADRAGGGDAEAPSARAARLLEVLKGDLAARRPHRHASFTAAGQNSASEALELLLDMVEPEESPAARLEHGAGGGDAGLGALFDCRQRASFRCGNCGHEALLPPAHLRFLPLLHYDFLAAPPRTAAAFARALRSHAQRVEGYVCPRCRTKTSAGPAGESHITYRLAMVSEILVCSFNCYGGARCRFYPPRFVLPAPGGGTLRYRLVAVVDHWGDLAGGHYAARALRRGRVFEFDDSRVAPADLAPRDSVYLVVYHFDGRETDETDETVETVETDDDAGEAWPGRGETTGPGHPSLLESGGGVGAIGGAVGRANAGGPRARL